MFEYSLNFDGAYKNKIASFGFSLHLDGQRIDSGWGILGSGPGLTSVVAEYYGLSYGLDSFVRHFSSSPAVLNIYGDSEFVIGQVKKDLHDYEQLQVIRLKLKQISRMVSKTNIVWIPRGKNKIANDLAKKLRSFDTWQDS